MRNVAGAALDAVVNGSSLARNVALGRRGRSASPWRGMGAAAVAGFAGDPRQWVHAGDHIEYPGDENLGWGLIRRWAEVRACCTAPSREALADGDGRRTTRIFCDARWEKGYTPQNTPHPVFEAENLIVDFGRIYPARTLRSRPRYRKGDGCQYHRYRAGALAGACGWTPAFGPDRLPPEHLRDMFASFRTSERHDGMSCDEEVEHPVLFVTREGEESRNIFHTAIDFLNAFESVLMVSPVARLDLGVVLLDNAPPAPFDAIWTRVFAPERGVRRVRDFGGRRVLFRRAIFSPPGYYSRFYRFLAAAHAPPARVGLLDAFSALMWRAHGIDPAATPASSALQVTLIARRPYPTHGYMARQITNEAACLEALATIEGVRVQAIDFAQHSIEDQIRIARHSDLLVGLHGAALTHALWTPAHAGLLEIDVAAGGSWQIFQNLCAWTGREYAGLAATEHAIPGGTAVTIDPARLVNAARQLAARVAARRAANVSA